MNPMRITKVSVRVDNFECTVKDFDIQVPNVVDNLESDWKTIKSFQAQCGNVCTTEQIFEDFDLESRYIRFFCRDNWGSGGGQFILITKIKFYGVPVRKDQLSIQPSEDNKPLESNEERWLDDIVKIQSCSSEHSDSFKATNLITPGTTYWLSKTGETRNQWVIFDFGRNVLLTKVSLQSDSFECSVKDFNIEVSDNDDLVSWRYIYGFQAQSGKVTTAEQFFDGFEFKGRYLRLYFVDNWGRGGGDYILITKTRFWGKYL